jgi:hypothetical protein
MKTDAGDVDLIAVGGGAFLVPDDVPGVRRVLRPPNADCANAVGAAIAQVSGEADRVVRDMTREDAIETVRREAVAAAVDAGADPDGVEIIDVEDMPLAYMPGAALRVRVRAVGPIVTARDGARDARMGAAE